MENLKTFENFNKKMNEGKFEFGDLVRISPSNDNDSYDEFREKDLVVTNVANNSQDHPGYDSSMEGESLYDLETKDGEEVPFSLYDYELVNA